MLNVLSVVSPDGVQTRLGIERDDLVKPIQEYFTAVGFKVQQLDSSADPEDYDEAEFYRSLCLFADFQHYKHAVRH